MKKPNYFQIQSCWYLIVIYHYRKPSSTLSSFSTKYRRYDVHLDPPLNREREKIHSFFPSRSHNSGYRLHWTISNVYSIFCENEGDFCLSETRVGQVPFLRNRVFARSRQTYNNPVNMCVCVCVCGTRRVYSRENLPSLIYVAERILCRWPFRTFDDSMASIISTRQPLNRSFVFRYSRFCRVGEKSSR